MSLSARRAWIEIRTILEERAGISNVALRKESVDRNPVVPAELTTLVKSLSARRAWIEILYPYQLIPVQVCRSPQGERG